jgi:hypothetical protein
MLLLVYLALWSGAQYNEIQSTFRFAIGADFG